MSTTKSGLTTIIGPSLMMSSLSMVSTALSFGYQLMVARRFGVQADMDAYLAAMAIPSYLEVVFQSSLSFTFIPVFVEHIAKGTEGEAWRIANTLLKLVAAVLTLICLAGFAFGPQLVAVMAPGFPAQGRELATWLLRILWPSMVFSGIFALLSNICFSLHKFALPAVAPVLYVVVNVVVLVALAPSLGIGSVALGTTLGQAAQVLLLLPMVLRVGKHLRAFDLRHPGVAQVLKLTAPLVGVGIITRSTDIIERFFASGLPEGSISYLGYALKLLTPMSTILVSGVVISIFPLMARQAATGAQGPGPELRETVARGFGLLAFITLPIAAWLAVLRVPIITLVLERGAFSHEATSSTAWALLSYLGYFVLRAVGNVTTRAFYVLKDTITPTKVRMGAVLVYVVLCTLLVRRLSFTGLALALSLYYLYITVVDIVLASRKLGGLPWRSMASAQAKIALASIALVGVTSLGWQATGPRHSALPARVLLSSSLGVTAYLVVAHLLRSEELLTIEAFAALKLKSASRLLAANRRP